MSLFIDEHRERFGVEPICRVLGVSASAYYHRRSAEPSVRTREDERLLEVICVTHKRNFEAYGYRRTWKALRRAAETAPCCQVQRLMRAHGICGAKRRGKPWRALRSPIPTLTAGRISCGATSPRRRQIVSVAEVTNTPWGERHAYVLSTGEDVGGTLVGGSPK